MLPRKPPRVGQVGFVYAPPYRVQGVSVAGEQTMVQIPELDLAFDIGLCPRIALASSFVALSHGHMDHVGGLPYYFSQRVFQGMGTGTCVCDRRIEEPLRVMLDSWNDLERQRTPYELVPLEPGEQVKIKNNVFLRAIETSHAGPSMGYVAIERRSKLKDEFRDQPQDRLRELKQRGVEITRTLEIPLVAYTGDTELCPGLFSEAFCRAPIVISECTFFDADHRGRAKVGKHLHVEDYDALLRAWEAETVVLVHVSRRSNLSQARARLAERFPDQPENRLRLLMDHRTNARIYEEQERAAREASGRDGENDAAEDDAAAREPAAADVSRSARNDG